MSRLLKTKEDRVFLRAALLANLGAACVFYGFLEAIINGETIMAWTMISVSYICCAPFLYLTMIEPLIESMREDVIPFFWALWHLGSNALRQLLRH